MIPPILSLYNQEQAAGNLAEVAKAYPELLFEVQEDKCFDGDKWLSLGKINIFPSPAEDAGIEDVERISDSARIRLLKRAVKFGQFSWSVPDASSLSASLKAVMGNDAEKASQAIEEAVQDIARRTGLMLPVFDPDVLVRFPFLTPATIVVDTSAVLQGGLDFAARFLYPMARIKVPIVVSLEIRNMADRFFAMRRRKPTPPKAHCLREHIKSQAGDRALMRLEYSDVEVERRVQNSDPFRMVFTPDTESEVNNLNLSQVQRSFADRLIIETAKEYLSQISPGQPLYVLTSDQGMSRTAVTEGLRPIHFEARKAAVPLGRTLQGTLFHPFHSTLYTVSLVDLLWEAATCFGRARFRTSDNKAELCVIALGEDIVWFPYQSKDNLLWCLFRYDDAQTSQPPVRLNVSSVLEGTFEPTLVSLSNPIEETPITNILPVVSSKIGSSGAYVISVARLLLLIQGLVENKRLIKEEAIKVLGVNSTDAYNQYRMFLLSGGFITQSDNRLEKTEALDQLWNHLIQRDLLKLRESLMHIPSFRAFLEYILQKGKQADWVKDSFTEKRGATSAYRCLAEISASAIAIPQQGIFLTLNVPPLNEFVDVAMETYLPLASSDLGALTGEWLEIVARTKGIHPSIVRGSIEDAYAASLLSRSYSGATPPLGYNDHTLDVLNLDQGLPMIVRYNLYTGDYMLAERASVYIRLERSLP